MWADERRGQQSSTNNGELYTLIQENIFGDAVNEFEPLRNDLSLLICVMS